MKEKIPFPIYVAIIAVILVFTIFTIKLYIGVMEVVWIKTEFGTNELIEFSKEIGDEYEEDYPKLITYTYSNRSNSPLFGLSNHAYVYKSNTYLGLTIIKIELAEKQGFDYVYLTGSSKGMIVKEKNEKDSQVLIFNMEEKKGSVSIFTQSKKHEKWMVERFGDESGFWYKILKWHAENKTNLKREMNEGNEYKTKTKHETDSEIKYPDASFI